MRVAVIAVVLVLVFCLSAAVVPAYGKPAEEKIGKEKVPAGYVDVIIYGGPAAEEQRGAGVTAVKEKTAAAKIKGAEPGTKTFEEYRSLDGVHAYIPAEAVAKLQAQGYTVAENGVAYILLDSSGPVVNADKARRSYLNGNGTKVCVLDTGIDFWHTQVQIPPSTRIADFVKRIDGPHDPAVNGTTNRFTVYVNQTQGTLNFSINWFFTGNRFDMYVWYPNGTYAGGTNASTPYADGGFYWMALNLTNAPGGLYNITTNDTNIATSSGEWLSVFWDPFYPAGGIFPSDYHGHGTHVAGTIAGNNSVYQGVAQGVTLYVASICEGATGSCGDSDMIAGMQWCIDNGVDIMSMSVGAPASSSCNHARDTMADTMASSVLPVIANGNTGAGGAGTAESPGCARKAVGVGAVNDAGSIAGFSSRGPTGDKRIKPDVVAPGVGVISTYIINTFSTSDGTSMATPHAAAVAAIAKQANPTWTVPILKAALMATANKTNSQDLDNDYGAGLVDAMQLVTKPYANATTLHRGDSFAAYGRWLAAENNYTVQTITNDTNFTMNITVPPGALSLKSVLYWEENYTDTRSQIHLYLFDPAGNLADNSIIPNSTVQMVYNNTLTAGQWTLNVSGANVQGSRQFVLFTSIKTNSMTYALAEVNITGTPQNFTAVPDLDRANYTNVTGNDWFVGPHQVKFYSNDTLNNWGTSGAATVTLYGWAGINESSKPASVNEDVFFTMACRVRDQNTTAPIRGHNVSFWINDAYIATSDTNSTGWANITISINDPNTPTLKCNITNSAALYYDSDGTSNQSTITVNDTTVPQYSGLANTSAVYGADWQGNATWTDNAYLSHILFESNFTGPAAYQYFPSISGSEFHFTIKEGNFTGGQVVKWRWFANDTSNNTNYTDWQYFTVAKGPTLVRLFLNGTEGNRSYGRGSIANLTATVNVSGKYVRLTANFSNFSVSENAANTATNMTNTTGLNTTEYNVTAYFVADQNHTASSITYFLKLLKANGESCSASSECYSGGCCSGACADSCGSPGSPSGGGGGGGAVGTTSTLLRVYADLNKWFQYEPEHRILEFPISSNAYYYFAGENHTIAVAATTNTTVILTIASTPYNITLSIGETRRIDLNNDGTADLFIILNGIKDGKADITFAKLEAAPPAEVPVQNATKEQENSTQEQPRQPEGKMELGITLLVLGVFLGIFGLAATRTAILKLGKRPKERR